MAATTDLLTNMEDIDDILSNLDINGTVTSSQTRAVRSLNRAQDMLERVIGRHQDILAEVDDTISQTVGQEYTALPVRTVRLDSVWFLDSATSRPTYEINAVRKPGGHRQRRPSPIFDTNSAANSPARPREYWWSHGNSRLYWDRDPDTTNSIRIVGFFGAADMTSANPDSTFAYDDSFIYPVAAVACEIFRLRRHEDWQELQTFADRYFQPVVDQMSHSHRHQEGDLRGSFANW